MIELHVRDYPPRPVMVRVDSIDLLYQVSGETYLFLRGKAHLHVTESYEEVKKMMEG